MEAEQNKVTKETPWHIGKACILINVVGVIFAAAYLFGAFSGTMEKITVISCINKILAIFSFHKSLWYEYVAATAQGIIYLVLGVLIIKATCRGFNRMKMKEENVKIASVFIEFKNIFRYCTIYVIANNMLNQEGLAGWGRFFLIVGLLFVSLGEVYKNAVITKKWWWQYALSSGVYTLVKGILLIVVGSYIVTPFIKEILGNVRILFFGTLDFSTGILAVHTLYKAIGVNIFHLILTVYLFQKMDEFFFYNKYESAWKKLFITACVYLAVDLILFMALVGGGAQIDIMQAVAGYMQSGNHLPISIILISGAGRATTFFPTFYKKPISQKTVKQKE